MRPSARSPTAVSCSCTFVIHVAMQPVLPSAARKTPRSRQDPCIELFIMDAQIGEGAIVGVFVPLSGCRGSVTGWFRRVRIAFALFCWTTLVDLILDICNGAIRSCVSSTISECFLFVCICSCRRDQWFRLCQLQRCFVFAMVLGAEAVLWWRSSSLGCCYRS